jgi:hypothetical protein
VQCLLTILLSCISFLASAGPKVESIGPLGEPSVSEKVRSALEPSGYRVLLPDGATACEVWLRKGLALQSKTDTQGALYSVFPDSSLIGVLSFTRASTDFRGQAIKPGFYTLRYALHPVDGNHLGISPNRDFLLASPVAVDRDPGAQFKFEELVTMSKQASGTNHPAGLSLVSPEGQKDIPAAVQDDNGRTVLVVKLKPASGSEIPLMLIVKGVAEQ